MVSVFLRRAVTTCRDAAFTTSPLTTFSRSLTSSSSTTRSPPPPSPPTESVDYVVVGAGSAGSVVASRLVEAGQSVALLEAGPSDRTGWHWMELFLHMPTALAWPMTSKRYNWAFEADPEPTLNNRIISCPRGKGLGGSSSINGMVYVRGHAATFDQWHHEMGALGWDYASVLPYFVKAECWKGPHSQYRGKDGPLHNKFGDNAAQTELFDLFVQAGAEAGYGSTADYNASRQEGFGPMAMTVFHSGPNKGMRCSTASAYLHPALERHGDLLHVRTNAMTRKIIFDNNQTTATEPKAIGVEYVEGDNPEKVRQVRAKKEVILCAGSIQSPQLLQVSGIGDKDHLLAIGLAEDEIIVDNRHVGQNLQDHLELYFQQEVIPPISISPVMRSYWQQFKVGWEWIFFRRGLGATNHFESAAFVRSSPDKTFPDVQFHFLPIGISYDGVSLAPSSTGHSMQVHVGTCRSKSRGYVQAKSTNALEPPQVCFNYMSHDEDWVDMRRAIEVVRQVMRQPALQGVAGDEILPGKGADLDEYIREHVESAYHPCGTCKMGSSVKDNQAVVDPSGKVFGVQSLRVVDASVFPTITNGNLNAPVIMLAERMSDLILGKDLLLPIVEFDKDHAPWIPPSFETDREREPLVA